MEIEDKPLGDMPDDEFRRYGYQLVDWIADYFQNIETFPVLSQVEPGWLTQNLPGSPRLRRLRPEPSVAD